MLQTARALKVASPGNDPVADHNQISRGQVVAVDPAAQLTLHLLCSRHCVSLLCLVSHFETIHQIRSLVCVAPPATRWIWSFATSLHTPKAWTSGHVISKRRIFYLLQVHLLQHVTNWSHKIFVTTD
jgi:hypothetical protein